MLRFQEQGDLDAFGELFQRQKDRFVDFLTRMAGNRAIAEDISQQVWTKVIDLARRGDYRRKAKFGTFLFTLGRNLYIDEFQRKHVSTRTDALEDRVVSDARPDANPGHGAMLDERGEILRAVMATLPDEQREVLAMWSVGTPIGAMAEIIGVPRDTVLSRKKYGISKMRAALAAAGIERDEL